MERLRQRLQIRPFHRQVLSPECNVLAVPSEHKKTVKKVSVNALLK